MITTINEWKKYNEKKSFDAFTAIARRNRMTDECMRLVVWWSLSGYLYYNTMTDKNPGIDDEGRRMLEIIFKSVADDTYNDYMNGRLKAPSHTECPVWCDENVYKHVGRNYVDDVFTANQVTLKKPMRVYKNYDEKRFVTGGKTAWYSFSYLKDYYKGPFGNDYIAYELPIGFKYLDCFGLADRGEILIDGKYLTKDMVVNEALSESPVMRRMC